MNSLPLPALLASGVVERATLFANHVIAAEPAAVERLRAHAGKGLRVAFEGWPGMLPAWPELTFAITPAGLLEWQGDAPGATPPDLLLAVDAANPALLLARGLAGERPRVEVRGDATLAGDVDWLIANLRWDARDDLARLVGPAAAQTLGRLGAFLVAGLREGLRLARSLAPRRSG